MNRPSAAESWCPVCLDWTLRMPGTDCLWCGTIVVTLDHEQPSLVLPVDVRYPKLAAKLAEAAEHMEPREDRPVLVRGEEPTCRRGHILSAAGTVAGVKDGRPFVTCRACRNESRRKWNQKRRAAK